MICRDGDEVHTCHDDDNGHAAIWYTAQKLNL